MSIISHRAAPSTAAVKSVVCFSCHSRFDMPADSWAVFPTCSTCRRSQAEHEARKLVADYIALREGSGIFADLRAEERAEQLVALRPDNPDPRTPAGRRQLCEMLSDDDLIDLGAAVGDEIRNRFDDPSPDPIERRRIEIEAQDDPYSLAA